MRKEKLLGILMDLRRHFRRKHLLLLWDGLPAHQAGIVRQFLGQNTSWLTVIRFPAYAPELNPQEFLWSGVKRSDLGNYCPYSSRNLGAKVYRSLRRRSREPSFLAGCLKASGLFTARELCEG
ncbi:MAG: transposase [Candidatus Liptonbacteria bacterium]|nr:transposase [Candidatus Liptonbacteria bacterium]